MKVEKRNHRTHSVAKLLKRAGLFRPFQVFSDQLVHAACSSGKKTADCSAVSISVIFYICLSPLPDANRREWHMEYLARVLRRTEPRIHRVQEGINSSRRVHLNRFPLRIGDFISACTAP